MDRDVMIYKTHGVGYTGGCIMGDNITKEEFEQRYCDRSGITIKYYKEWFVTLPCDCGASACHGWAAVSNQPLAIETYNELYYQESKT